ncbi:MAG: glycoside hydrolase family 43 protein [Clostridia bacterium]|nr:glycoside hydrolase family 43 protein [Clostridia bacterium]
MKWAKRLMGALLLAALFTGCTGTEKPTDTQTTAVTTEEVPQLTEIENGTTIPGIFYTNKLTDGTADPFILEHDGTYYLYCTGGSKFSVRTSTDLVNWKTQSTPILSLSDLGWAKEKGWAPEVYEYNGKFYFIFSAMGYNGFHSIDIAVCDTPSGKFKPLKQGEPFFSPEFSVIDASLFFDDDGRVYMYYSKDNSTNYVNGKRTSQTWGVELKADLSGIIGEPVLISTPVQSWELKSGSVVWNEGPVVFKENGTYYLLYSANYYTTEHYSVGYATSDSPLKMFVKTKNCRILAGNGETVTGPGHCNILRSPDGTEIYIVYHVHTVPPTVEKGRSLAIDRLIIREDGTLAVDGPSETRRLLPSGLGGYYHLHDGFTYSATGEKAEFASKSKIENLFDGICKGGIDGSFSLDDGGTVEIRLDTPQDVAAVWIYPSVTADYQPAKVDVEINGTYVIKDRPFRGAVGNPATIYLDTLPEGTKVETVKVTVYLTEGLSYAALSEIALITR